MIVYILLFLFVTIGIFNLIMASLLRMSANAGFVRLLFLAESIEVMFGLTEHRLQLVVGFPFLLDPL